MTLKRTLEPEVMDSAVDAIQYNDMDHSEVNQRFVAELLAYAQAVYKATGSIGNTDESSDEDADGFRLGDVLDMGTGTARIPVELCKQHLDCRVMAIDMAVSMLELAVYNIEAAAVPERITLAQVDAKKMPYEDGMFDVVMSNSIIHHIPEPLGCLQEMVRVTADQGIIFVRDLMRPDNVDTLQHLVRTYAGKESEYSQKLFEDSLHAALSLEEIRDMVRQLGYDPKTVKATTDRHWTWATVVE